MRSKHILVPLELVRGPASALAFVRQMAAEAPVRVTLLHVVELNILPTQPAVIDQLCAESEAGLRELARLFFGAEQTARIVVRTGKAAGEIIEEAKVSGADLIVMCGSKTGRPHLLRRGTMQQVVNSAACPTLVLPHSDKARAGEEALRGRRFEEEERFLAEKAAEAAA